MRPVANVRVSCIVLNWNGWKDTIGCLNALQGSSYPIFETIVIDNGSTDDSVQHIRDAHPDIELIESGENLGFARGNNIGIRKALARGADFVWLLNNDTVPDCQALAALVEKAKSDNRIGAIASVCYFADSPDTVQAWAGGRVNLWIGYPDIASCPKDDSWFEWLNATSLLLDRRALEDAGLLDERFFLYWEDVEIGLRLRKHHWKLAAAPDSRILHKVNASTGGNKATLTKYTTCSGLRILRLHSPVPFLAMFVFVALRFAKRIITCRFAGCRDVWAGIRDYCKQNASSAVVRHS